MTFLNLSLGRPVIRVRDSITGELGVVGARFVMSGDPSEGRFSLVEHPIVPRGLAAPVHVHTREDEFSFVLEGRWGFQLASDVVYAEPGDLVYKPRNVWHTFWNVTSEPALPRDHLAGRIRAVVRGARRPAANRSRQRRG
jgi:mannose-6-phosphate isomerase-like protein (cupin superfamily)